MMFVGENCSSVSILGVESVSCESTGAPRWDLCPPNISTKKNAHQTIAHPREENGI